MVSRLYVTCILLSTFFLANSGFAQDAGIAKKSKKPVEFKYKLQTGDVSREFVSDLVGNVSSYFYDLFKNFKKHPYILGATLAAAIPSLLYQKELSDEVYKFVYGDGKELKGHRLELTSAAWICLAVACLTQDKWTKRCFKDDEEAVFSETNKED